MTLCGTATFVQWRRAAKFRFGANSDGVALPPVGNDRLSPFLKYAQGLLLSTFPGRAIQMVVGMDHKLQDTPLRKLRWYKRVTNLLRRHWTKDGTTTVKLDGAAPVFLLGAVGTGKTMYRNFLAAKLLGMHRWAGSSCLIVLDRSGISAKPIFMRLSRKGRKMKLHVASPTTHPSALIEINMARDTGIPVYHLLDVRCARWAVASAGRASS